MKKIKMSTFIFLMAIAVFALTACTNRGSSSTQQSSGSTQESSSTAGGAQDSTQSPESGGTGGMIDGLIDDVDQGVRDMTGDDTRAADETSR